MELIFGAAQSHALACYADAIVRHKAAVYALEEGNKALAQERDFKTAQQAAQQQAQ